MAPFLSYPPDINKHLALVNYGKQTAGHNRGLIEQLKTTPLFSSKLLAGNNAALLPQYGLIGMRLETYGNQPLVIEENRESPQQGAFQDGRYPPPQQQQPEHARDSLVYANINAPWSTFICGSQGSGKSHTLSCMLENSLMNPSGTGKISSPLTGLVLHYDKFTGIDTGQLCEAAYLCSSGIPVRVLVSPSSFSRMKKLYSNLPGLPQGVEPPKVVPMKFLEKHLTIATMKSLMAVGGDGHSPLYMEVVSKVLRDMAIEDKKFDFMDFKSRLDNTDWVKGQKRPLEMRLKLLESFLDFDNTAPVPTVPSGPKRLPRTNGARAQASNASPNAPLPKRENIGWNFDNGTLTIVDLSCPFVDETDACALFNICLGIFLESRDKGGRIVALDEAHKFLSTTNREATALTETMLSLIRQQRHLATRVIIATQEPTLSPKLLDLSNVTIVHRFASPAWFKILKGHLAGAVVDSQCNVDNIFSRIVCLKTGEALIFSPSAILDVDDPASCDDDSDASSSDETSRSDDGDTCGSDSEDICESHKHSDDASHSSIASTARSASLDFRELGPRYVKMRIRNRVTADGGRSILAQEMPAL